MYVKNRKKQNNQYQDEDNQIPTSVTTPPSVPLQQSSPLPSLFSSECCCSIDEFAVYFLNFLRNQTEDYMRGTSSTCNTPRKLSTSITKLSTNITESDNRKSASRSLFPVNQTQTPETQSPIKPYQEKNSRTSDDSIPNSFQNLNENSPRIFSTPVRSNHYISGNNTRSPNNNSFNSPSVTGNRHQNQSNRRTPSSSFSLEDFIVASSASKSKNRKSTKQLQASICSPFSSEKDFPSLGHRSRNTTSTPNETPSKDNFDNKPRKRVAPITLQKHSGRNEFGSPAFRTDNNLLNISHEDAAIPRNLLKSHIDVISKDFQNEKTPERGIHASLIDKRTFDKPSMTSSVDVKIDLGKVNHENVLTKIISIHSAIIDLNLTTNILTELSFLLNLLNVECENFPPTSDDVLSYAITNTATNTTTTTTSAAGAIDESSKSTTTWGGDFAKPHLINHQTNDIVTTKACTSIAPTTTAGSSTIHINTSVAMAPNAGVSFVCLENIFKNINNCIFYSLGVLDKQRHILGLLDCTTMKVLLENERLSEFNENIKEFLLHAYSHKLKLESIERTQNISFKVDGNGTIVGRSRGNSHMATGPINVFYQQEYDTKDNFPSMKEFMAFRKQRDLFCSIFGLWEGKHFNPAWTFDVELGSKIRNLMALSDHPINMAHLAKLFASQLILCCNYDDPTPDLQMALPEADRGKLSKLQQRLIAPSSFSTDYQFPGNQLFFKDFLTVTQSNSVFLEQLKIVLVAELTEMNCSSFETLGLSAISEQDDFEEYVVRPETVLTMKVIAKFLGLIMAKPFAYEGTRNATVDNRQIELRNRLQPQFDIKSLLLQSIANQKLLITIPWLVQFLAMLDYITLRLDHFTDILNTLFKLYIWLANPEAKFKMRTTSIFILKACLGWLFEQPNVPDDYYKYRKNQNELNANNSILFLAKNSTGNESLHRHRPLHILTTFDPLLEQILIAACPFLADFRVSIMPPKHSKSVSRTGRFRHITTKITESPKAKQIESDSQNKLIEAFLQSQTLSVRRTIEFVTERTISAVIKNFQVEIMVPSKKDIVEQASKIQANDAKEMKRKILECYTEAVNSLMVKWDEIIPSMIIDRVTKAFDALLANETLPAVKRTCISISVQRCKTKSLEWRAANLNKLDFFSKDVTGDAEKIFLNKQPQKIVEFDINLTKLSPSQVMSELQLLLHNSSICPDIVSLDDIQEVLKRLIECLTEHILPSNICRITGFMVLQLLQLLVCNRPDLITSNLLTEFTKLWNCKSLENFTKKETKINDDDKSHSVTSQQTLDTSSTSDGTERLKIVSSQFIFDNILSVCYLTRLSTANTPSSSQSYKALEHCLIHLIKNNFLSLKTLNEQSVTLLRNNWPVETHEQISKVLKNVVDEITPNDQQAIDLLFLEMLSDLSRDIDVF